MARKFGLKLSAICVDTTRFQPRNLYANQVRNIRQRKRQTTQQLEELVSYLNTDSNHKLDPLKVWKDPSNDSYYVVDGHHRLKAYKESKWRPNKKVPCVVIQADDAHEALAQVFIPNARCQLGYTKHERIEAAWKERCRLEQEGMTPTVKHVVETFSISAGTASNFNKVIRHLKARNDDQMPPKVDNWKAYKRHFEDDEGLDDLKGSSALPYVSKKADDIVEVFAGAPIDEQQLIADLVNKRMNESLEVSGMGHLTWVGPHIRDELEVEEF